MPRNKPGAPRSTNTLMRDPRALALLALSVAIMLVVMLLDPMAQDASYHRFIDHREVASIPNAWNVLSNLPFVFIGLAGLLYVVHLWRRAADLLVWPYLATFAGVLLTGFGSAWYHLAPGNESLFWDRLPMTLGFMGFFSSVIGELVSRRLAHRLLGPLLLAGTGSVLYWLITERLGAGDLRPYALVQFLPLLLMPLMLMLYPRPRHYTSYIVALFGCYALSKGFELLDAEIFALGGLVGGHALKHLAAAAGIACLLPMLHARYHNVR